MQRQAQLSPSSLAARGLRPSQRAALGFVSLQTSESIPSRLVLYPRGSEGSGILSSSLPQANARQGRVAVPNICTEQCLATGEHTSWEGKNQERERGATGHPLVGRMIPWAVGKAQLWLYDGPRGGQGLWRGCLHLVGPPLEILLCFL